MVPKKMHIKDDKQAAYLRAAVSRVSYFIKNENFIYYFYYLFLITFLNNTLAGECNGLTKRRNFLFAATVPRYSVETQIRTKKVELEYLLRPVRK